MHLPGSTGSGMSEWTSVVRKMRKGEVVNSADLLAFPHETRALLATLPAIQPPNDLRHRLFFDAADLIN